MFHVIYKTTNLINNKIYIGVHSTENIDDGYLGSGRLIGHAIKKYGPASFSREILSYHEDEISALFEEARIVDKEFIERNDTYNICLGGGKPPTPAGEDHPLYGSKRPDASDRMRLKNPSTLEHVKAKHRNTTTVYDPSLGRNVRLSKDDPRWLSGELKHINHGKITVKDKDGNCFHVSKDDPRWLSGELIQASKGKKRYWSQETVDVLYATRRGRKQSHEEIEKRSKSLRGHVYDKVACPHCSVVGGVSVMKRWHFDRCRSKPTCVAL
jgi:hypothetical protein